MTLCETWFLYWVWFGPYKTTFESGSTIHALVCYVFLKIAWQLYDKTRRLQMWITAAEQHGWKMTKRIFRNPLGMSWKMYATLKFSWKFSWQLPWHRTKMWFYSDCGLACSRGWPWWTYLCSWLCLEHVRFPRCNRPCAWYKLSGHAARLGHGSLHFSRQHSDPFQAVSFSPDCTFRPHQNIFCYQSPDRTHSRERIEIFLANIPPFVPVSCLVPCCCSLGHVITDHTHKCMSTTHRLATGET